jgi:hypothetical protein
MLTAILIKLRIKSLVDECRAYIGPVRQPILKFKMYQENTLSVSGPGVVFNCSLQSLNFAKVI